MRSSCRRQYLLIPTTLLLMAVQEAMFRSTAIGPAMRATAQDAGAARLMGIRTDRVVAIIFASATMLAGWLLSPLFYASADMGGKVSLDAFAACILGGVPGAPAQCCGGRERRFSPDRAAFRAAAPSA